MKGEFYKMEYEAWDEAMEHLTLEQEACALRLIHQMYRRRGPVPNHLPTLARLWRSHQNKARSVLATLLKDGIIRETPEGHLINTRVRRELDARETQRTHRSDAGKTGGRRSGQVRQMKAEKSNDFNENDEALASTSLNENEPEERRGEKRRVEESRESKVGSAVSDDGPLPWEILQAPAEQQSPEKTYAFIEGIIRLNEADYEKLKRTYRGLNLDAELMGIAPWAEEQSKFKGGNWYQPMIGALNKKLRQIEAQAREAKATADARVERDAKNGQKGGSWFAPGQMAI